MNYPYAIPYNYQSGGIFFLTGGGGPIGRMQKSVASQVLTSVDYTGVLLAGVGIASVAYILDLQTNPALVISNTGISGQMSVLTFILSGGFGGAEYNITINATLSDGTVRTDVLNLVVQTPYGGDEDYPGSCGGYACAPSGKAPWTEPIPLTEQEAVLGASEVVFGTNYQRYFVSREEPQNAVVSDRWLNQGTGEIQDLMTDGTQLFWQAIGVVNITGFYLPITGGVVTGPLTVDSSFEVIGATTLVGAVQTSGNLTVGGTAFAAGFSTSGNVVGNLGNFASVNASVQVNAPLGNLTTINATTVNASGVVAAPTGNLATVNATTVNVSGVISASGDCGVGGTIYVSGDCDVGGGINTSGSVAASLDVTAGRNMSVVGTAYLGYLDATNGQVNGSLVVAGGASFGGGVSFAAYSQVNNSFGVTGNLQVNGQINSGSISTPAFTAGTSSFYGQMSVSGSLGVAGNVQVNGNLQVNASIDCNLFTCAEINMASPGIINCVEVNCQFINGGPALTQATVDALTARIAQLEATVARLAA